MKTTLSVNGSRSAHGNGAHRVANLVSEYRGIYNRIAAQMGVDPSYVSRIARGERNNEPVRLALLKEVNRLHQLSTKLVGR
jgi:transcriptional regulator with XRE-family HTH domain